MNNIFEKLDKHQQKKIEALGKKFILAYWLKEGNIILDGRPFTFDKHEYLADIYLDDSPVKVWKKAAQLGASTYEMLSTVHGCKNIFPTGVLYLFPTRDDVTDFSKTRFGRLIDENPQTIGTWVTNTDQANLKQVGTSFLYLRGSRTRTALKSIPVDKIVFDEFDEMRPGSGAVSGEKTLKFDPIALARERYSHSEFQHEDILSTPTLPDYGIEAEYAKSDQKFWYIRCEKCNTYTCLELTFPDCFVVTGKGKVIRGCKKCQAEIHPRNGQWVAHYPSNDISGYYISQLNSMFINYEDLCKTYMNLDNLSSLQRTEYYNSKIGIGYVEVKDRLAKQNILGLCESEPMITPDRGDAGPCIMGVDQGNKLHVIVGKKIDNKNIKVIHVQHYKKWEDLDRLMDRFNVWRCVVDSLPEQRNARKFANNHFGKVFLNYYNQHQKGSVKWDYPNLSVQENRTESLDESHNQIMYGYTILPRQSDEVDAFATHCCNIAKKLEVDDESGSKKYVYVKLGGPDHYRHAFNYLCIASENAPIADEPKHRVEGFRGFQFPKEEETRLCQTYH